ATMRDQLAGLPGVEAVSTGSLPLTESFRRMDLKVDGRPLASGAAAPTAGERVAGAGYFKSIGVPLLRGRLFTSADENDGRDVIVNQAFADRIFPGEDPVRKRFAETNRIAQYAMAPDIWFTIVGIVGNTRDDGLDEEMRPAFYHPTLDERSTGGSLVIRARAGSDAEALTQPVVQIIRQL